MSYYTLVTALPDLPPLARCQQLPISRIALERRLTMLSDADRLQLRLAEQLYHPDLTQPARPDPEQIRFWQEQLNQIHSEDLRFCIQLRLEWQSILAALRQRQQGEQGPEAFFGFGRWTNRIRQHWHEPTFALEDAMPLIRTLQPLMQQGAAGEVEQQLNHWLWQNLLHTERSHAFSTETVICFVLRWGLAEKQICNDASQALATFDHLAGSLLSTPMIKAHLESAFEELI